MEHEVNIYHRRLERGPLVIELEYIGEGYGGDYDEGDPQDAPLLRFYVGLEASALPADENPGYEAGQTVQFRDGSACTELDAGISEAEADRALAYMAAQIEAADPGWELRKTFAQLSYLTRNDIPAQAPQLGQPKAASHWASASLDY